MLSINIYIFYGIHLYIVIHNKTTVIEDQESVMLSINLIA